MTDMTTGAELRAPAARGRAPGRDRLSVLVRIDRNGRHVSLVVTGPLTGTSQKALAPLAVRARTLFPESDLTVDLYEAPEAEPAAVDLLRWSLDEVRPVTGPVRITAPGPSRDRQPVGFPVGGTP
jgi:hypothetical protein